RGNGTYSYQVRACSTVCSAFTAAVGVQVALTPGVPGAITGPASDSDGAYSISWTAGTGTITSYSLEEQVNGGAFTVIQSNLSTSASFTGKTNNTYGYRAMACNGSSCSGYTATKTVQVTGNP